MNTLDIHRKEGYAIVQMNRGKANAINLEMVNELSQTFHDLEEGDSIKGVILTGQPHFSPRV